MHVDANGRLRYTADEVAPMVRLPGRFARFGDEVITLLTVGHGTLAADAFAALVSGVHVERIVDVRSFPGSRHNPQFGREEMQRWLPAVGLEYLWLRDLGGRRRPVPGSKHHALRNDAFRAYADYMESEAFVAGVDELLTHAAQLPSAVMCSETVWWRCHRRLLADYLVLVRGVDVVHLMHDGRLTPHPPTAGVRSHGDSLVYDVGTTPPLPATPSSGGGGWRTIRPK